MARLKLSSKQQAFLHQMKENEELARHGYNLLLKRPDFDKFFDALKEAGLFDASRNPAPIPAEEEGYFRIPYWSALDYLVGCANRSDERQDLDLSDKVLTVVREVSAWKNVEGKPVENYHTAHKFTEILGRVPTKSVLPSDIELISQWLNNRFERLLVSSQLNELVIPRFLSSTEESDWVKATLILEQCTRVEVTPRDGSKLDEAKPVLNDYYLQSLISSHVKAFGEKQPVASAGIFIHRIREVFTSEIHQKSSTTFRSTIEDNVQNHSFRVAENVFVQGLRDVLLSAAQQDVHAIKHLLEDLLTDALEILRRIAIYVINQRWDEFQYLYPKLLEGRPFTFGHLHELYGLLSAHFLEMSNDQKDQTFGAINTIDKPSWSDEPEIDLKRIKFRWLSSIAGKGHSEADRLFGELRADPAVGPLPDHVEYNSYITSWSGPGPSAYSASELVAFAQNGSLSETLNNYKPSSSWRGPRVEGLASQLEDAVRNQPQVFLRVLPDLLKLRPYFQHSVITALKGLWDSKQSTFDEADWKVIFDFFQQVIALSAAAPEEDKTYRSWVLTAIAESVEAGTKDDGHAFSPDRFEAAQAIVATLLEITESPSDFPDDPMFRALNTPKGRTISALFNFALRTCRVADKSSGSHDKSWSSIRPLFEKEIDKCRDANYEFSTQCGANLAQLEYLSPEWVEQNILKIFAKEFAKNDMCALAGLAYASFTKRTYEHLLSSTAIERGLEYKTLPGSETKHKLLERIVAAYLWGVETLDSLRMKLVFSGANEDDLQHMAWIVWTIRGKDTTQEQKRRIVAFWQTCIKWSKAQPTPPKRLLSSLASLTYFLDDAEGSAYDLLKEVGPFVHTGHDAYEFFEQLGRLAQVNPGNVCSVLEVMIAAHTPDYDYEDRLLKTLKVLVEKGFKNRVLGLLEKVGRLPQMHEYFNQLIALPA